MVQSVEEGDRGPSCHRIHIILHSLPFLLLGILPHFLYYSQTLLTLCSGVNSCFRSKLLNITRFVEYRQEEILVTLQSICKQKKSYSQLGGDAESPIWRCPGIFSFCRLEMARLSRVGCRVCPGEVRRAGRAFSWKGGPGKEPWGGRAGSPKFQKIL